MSINSKTREVWAEKTFELTNLGAGALIFGQFLSDKGFSWQMALAGVFLIVSGYLLSLVLLSKK